MILSTDTPRSIFLAMREENEKVAFHLKKMEKRFEKTFLNAIPYLPFGKPMGMQEIYTVPGSRNAYLVWVYAESAAEVRSRTWAKGSALIMTNFYGKRTFVTFSDTGRDLLGNRRDVFNLIQFYSGHFLSRYRERSTLGCGIKPNELAMMFFARNSGHLAVMDLDAFNDNHDKYENGYAFQIRDGITFGTIVDERLDDGSALRVFHHNTFIGSALLTENQEKNVLSNKELASMIREDVLSEIFSH